MKTPKRHRKYGAVVLLDALGASKFSDEKIKEFLSARSEIISIVRDLAKQIRPVRRYLLPKVFTFGDTIVATMELRSKRSITDDITVVKLLMRRYLFHALESGILFRGAFSIGSYIEDARTNTVMGEAVSDAASWYDKAAWMGLSSTPRTNTVLEFHYADRLDDSRFIHKYDVPLKSGKTFGLYAISWPGLFLDTGMLELEKKTDGRRWFLEILHKLSVPEGTETIFENTKRYFSFIESALLEKL